MKLADRVAIVTGGSQGLGEVIARRYAAEGASVAIVNRTHIDKAQAVVADIERAGGRAASFPADTGLVPEIQRVVGEVIDRFGTVDILVNNAGITRTKPFETLTEEDWDSQLDVNLKGPFFLVQAVAPEFKRKRRGKVINIASTAGVVALENESAYCASKGGLIALTRALCVELAPFGINVNALSPGWFATAMNEPLLEDPDFAARLRSLTPTGQDLMPPEDLGGTAVFLASDDSNAIHGANIVVDAGWTVL